MKNLKYIINFTTVWIIFLSFICSACNSGKDPHVSFSRFDNDLFSINSDSIKSNISNINNNYPGFFPIFTEHVIGIGPISDPNLNTYLKQFVEDPIIADIYSQTNDLYINFSEHAEQIGRAITNYQSQTDSPLGINLIGFISGFNQSFVSLDTELAIGLDNYLGSDCKFYKQLGLPEYIIAKMAPEYLVADATRAWIQSDLEGSFELETVLDNIIFEGKIIYTAIKALKKENKNKVLRYSDEQALWCKKNEKSMWKFMVDTEMLFSSDALMIQRVSKEAPFTRDFGTDSPPRAGAWIGYRIVEKFMSKNKVELKDMLFNLSAQEILSKSAYRP